MAKVATKGFVIFAIFLGDMLNERHKFSSKRNSGPVAWGSFQSHQAGHGGSDLNETGHNIPDTTKARYGASGRVSGPRDSGINKDRVENRTSRSRGIGNKTNEGRESTDSTTGGQ